MNRLSTLCVMLLALTLGALTAYGDITAVFQPSATTRIALGAVGLEGDETIAGDKTFTGTLMPSGRLHLPMGEISYFSVVGAAVPILASSTAGTINFVCATPTTALTDDGMSFDNGGSNNGFLRYTGTTTRMFHVAASVSFSGGNADTFSPAIAKNGTPVLTTRGLRKMGTGGDVGSTAIHGMIELATNDTLSLCFCNTTDADDPTVHAINLFAVGM